MALFESYWKIGTRQRTAYALALWLGNRASDVCRLKWSDLTIKHIVEDGEITSVEGFEFIQFKGRKRGKAIFLPMTPMLKNDLSTLSRDTETVLISSRGKPYKDGFISAVMSEWCKEAGISQGYTMHGLRKSLGVKLAEADASTRQLMEMLGHNNITYAELYSREASQVKLAVQGMNKVVLLEQAKQKAK